MLTEERNGLGKSHLKRPQPARSQEGDVQDPTNSITTDSFLTPAYQQPSMRSCIAQSLLCDGESASRAVSSVAELGRGILHLWLNGQLLLTV